MCLCLSPLIWQIAQSLNEYVNVNPLKSLLDYGVTPPFIITKKGRDEYDFGIATVKIDFIDYSDNYLTFFIKNENVWRK